MYHDEHKEVTETKPRKVVEEVINTIYKEVNEIVVDTIAREVYDEVQRVEIKRVPREVVTQVDEVEIGYSHREESYDSGDGVESEYGVQTVLSVSGRSRVSTHEHSSEDSDHHHGYGYGHGGHGGHHGPEGWADASVSSGGLAPDSSEDYCDTWNPCSSSATSADHTHGDNNASSYEHHHSAIESVEGVSGDSSADEYVVDVPYTVSRDVVTTVIDQVPEVVIEKVPRTVYDKVPR